MTSLGPGTHPLLFKNEWKGEAVKHKQAIHSGQKGLANLEEVEERTQRVFKKFLFLWFDSLVFVALWYFPPCSSLKMVELKGLGSIFLGGKSLKMLNAGTS